MTFDVPQPLIDLCKFIIKNWEPITLGIIAWLGYNHKNKTEKDINEVKQEQKKTNKAVLDLDNSIEIQGVRYKSPVQSSKYTMSKISEAYFRIFEQTPATRFLELYATNGIKDLTTINSEFGDIDRTSELAKEGSKHIVEKYRDFELDPHYHQMLKMLEEQGFLIINVNELPVGCKLKDKVYNDEGIKHALWFFLKRKKVYDENGEYTKNDIMYYCTVATHDPQGFSIQDIEIINKEISYIKTFY